MGDEELVKMMEVRVWSRSRGRASAYAHGAQVGLALSFIEPQLGLAPALIP